MQGPVFVLLVTSIWWIWLSDRRSDDERQGAHC